ncbi:MAG: hypothetical protein JXA44_10465 [Methanospirillaceae archaeon]|nr:hypothetical protein [Methanospirillaceae archaeon]
MSPIENNQDKNSQDEPLYDLIFPPGTPRSIIRDIITKFDVEMVERTEKLSFANMDGDARTLLAVRGPYAVMQEVEDYFKEKMVEFVS